MQLRQSHPCAGVPLARMLRQGSDPPSAESDGRCVRMSVGSAHEPTTRPGRRPASAWNGKVFLGVPVYAGVTEQGALEEPHDSMVCQSYGVNYASCGTKLAQSRARASFCDAACLALVGVGALHVRCHASRESRPGFAI